jgi:hypothetical protein
LFKITIQDVSLWYFHVYIFWNPNLFIPFIFLLSTLVPFLWWLQQIKKVLYSFLYRKYINHIHLFYFFLLSSLSH